jgi:hypothetical protein
VEISRDLFKKPTWKHIPKTEVDARIPWSGLAICNAYCEFKSKKEDLISMIHLSWTNNSKRT